MIDLTSFITGIIIGGLGTLVLLSFSLTSPSVNKISDEEIEKELLDNEEEKD